MKVLFAPDYREGNPYQDLLATALERREIEVVFASGYRHGLPLYRLARGSEADVFHLHWPEAYVRRTTPPADVMRLLRLPIDYGLTARSMPVVVTAHNLRPHSEYNRSPLTDAVHRHVLRSACAVFVHSEAGVSVLADSCAVRHDRCHVIPHGDLAEAMPVPVGKKDARRRLGLNSARLCLMFGAVEPYKGIEEVLEFWRAHRPPVELVVAGIARRDDYRRHIQDVANGIEQVRTELRFLSADELALWLSASDCVVFNYRTIFCSGAAALARSWGLPILLPERLSTVDLNEPHPLVLRFSDLQSDFNSKLEQACRMEGSYDRAQDWRASTDWDRIAEKTAEVYRGVMERSGR